MSRACYLSAVPEPHTILGLRLRPFALGHMELLCWMESAFVYGGEVTHEDLALSVLICSHTYEGALEALNDPGRDQFMERWANEFGPFNLYEKAEAFREYMRLGSVSIDANFPNADGNGIDAPMHQIIKVALMMNMNHTPSEALNKPWGLAVTDWITMKAIKGEADLVTSEEMDESLRLANEFDAKVRAKGLNGPR